MLPFLAPAWVTIAVSATANPGLPSMPWLPSYLLPVISHRIIRNYKVFHRFIPFRDNMGIVLRLGTKGSTSYRDPTSLAPGTTSRNGM